MSAGGALAILGAVDRLYAEIVAAPESWTEIDISRWAGELTAGYPDTIDREMAKRLRRIMRAARNLAKKRIGLVPSTDYRGDVDAVLGTAGWRPALDFAVAALDRWPDPELFDRVAELFRAVNFTEWHNGAGYDEWLANRNAASDTAPGG